MNWKYVKPLKNANAVKEFEEANGFSLPQDICDCIQEYNGGRPDRKCFDTEETEGRMIKCLLSYNPEDPETVYDACKALPGENLVPVASEPGGDLICYDETDKTIVVWLHETNGREKVADTFTEFLDDLY